MVSGVEPFLHSFWQTLHNNKLYTGQTLHNPVKLSTGYTGQDTKVSQGIRLFQLRISDLGSLTRRVFLMVRNFKGFEQGFSVPVSALVLSMAVFGMMFSRVEQTGFRQYNNRPGSSDILAMAYADAEQVKIQDQGPSAIASQESQQTLFGWPLLAQEPDATSTMALSASSIDSIMTYEVGKDDTLALLAQKFGISENTIVWVNNLKGDTLQPGQRLLILPMSGILHQVKPQETVESIAALYNISSDRVRAANHLADAENVFVGEQLIIPGGDMQEKLAFAISTPQAGALSETRNAKIFRVPTTGWNSGKLHYDNAVDIANACGTPVYASASGFVTNAVTQGWNDGYGGFIKIDHGNNIQTVYAHVSAQFVSSGAYVNAGDLIGAIGDTGRVDGITGCHLHFEVHGAANPFAR